MTKVFNFYYDRTPIKKSQFEKNVPENWREKVRNGTFSWGYYRAEKIEW